MRLASNPDVHLTYCLNIHPGESWTDNFAAVRDKADAVRARVSGGRPFGLGLRLSAKAAGELAVPETLSAFKAFLAERNMYVFTINGFPYGAFSGTRVKTEVYRPDWRDPKRVEYTNLLADILAALLPEGVPGSISTVPGSYKNWIRGSADVSAMTANIGATADHLAGVLREKGADIRLALEPEPDCYLETTAETTAFFTGPLAAVANAAAVRDRVGVCFDTCHLAVQFEFLAESAARMRSAGIVIAKVQASNALRVPDPMRAKAELQPYCDEVYLHQTKSRSEHGGILSYADLTDALQSSDNFEGAEWRIHFHVPLFFESLGRLASTGSSLDERFFSLLREGVTPHVEIETYTYDVLPPELRSKDVVDHLEAEYNWMLSRLAPKTP